MGKRGPKPVWTEEKVQKLFDDMLVKVKADDSILWIGSAVAEMGVRHQRISDWQKKYPKTVATFDEIKKIIENRIVVGALNGKLNASFAKFVLINSSHNWVSEKVASEIEHKGSGMSFNVNVKGSDGKDIKV